MGDQLFYELREAVLSDLSKAESFLKANPEAISARDNVGETVFHWVVVEDLIEIADWLLMKGSDINNKTDFGDTPLLEAASLGYLDMCKYLLSKGADLRVRSDHGYTALGAAAIEDELEVAKLLLENLSPDEDINSHMDKISIDVLLDKEGACAKLLVKHGLRT